MTHTELVHVAALVLVLSSCRSKPAAESAPPVAAPSTDEAVTSEPVVPPAAAELAETSAEARPAAADPAAESEPGTPVAEPAGPPELLAAISVLRNIDPSKMTEEQRDSKAKDLAKAWGVIGAAGEAGTDALRSEIARVEAAGERDDRFVLGAAALLWRACGAAEAPMIARLWRGADLAVNYNYVFPTAIDAARSHDPAVLPVLEACLKDKRGGFFVVQHYLEIEWPLTVRFIWGAYGPGGLARLTEILETSRNPTALESALHLVAESQYLEALMVVRALALAKDTNVEVRRAALRCLGRYGHPDDYPVLVKGLESDDVELASHCAWGLYEYGDLRAVVPLCGLLESTHDPLRQEAMQTLVRLLSPRALSALRAFSEGDADEKERAWCARQVEGVLKTLELSWDEYAALDGSEKSGRLSRVRALAEMKYVLKPDDKRLTREQLHEACAEWIAANRITGGTYEWVEDRHVLGAARAEDIELLLKVRAAVYLRVSDECLSEVRTLEGLVTRLGRRRYRKVVGVCDRVEAP